MLNFHNYNYACHDKKYNNNDSYDNNDNDKNDNLITMWWAQESIG